MVDGPPQGPAPGWFDEVARYLGSAYLKHAFTKGTDQEVGFLVDALGLTPGARVLDVGCGPGRHALALARLGLEVVGVDRSIDFIALARDAARLGGLDGARFVCGDVRALPLTGGFDALVCLCQGGFGLLGGRDEIGAFAQMAGRVRPDGAIALSAFSAAFAVRHLEEGEEYDVATGVLHEHATVRGDDGEAAFELWTTCFTARELALLAERGDVVVEGIHGVAPGRYGTDAPSFEHPELLLVGRRGRPGFPNARGEQ